ncbi:Il11ra [Columba guinea]|nr:Il11ra [Columba guinea]
MPSTKHLAEAKCKCFGVFEVNASSCSQWIWGSNPLCVPSTNAQTGKVLPEASSFKDVPAKFKTQAEFLVAMGKQASDPNLSTQSCKIPPVGVQFMEVADCSQQTAQSTFEQIAVMRSPIPGLGRVMVFLAAALASASLAVPEGWEEEGVQYGQVGTDVTLLCAGAHSGSLVQWRRAGAEALPEGSAIHHGALVLPHAGLSSAGTYSCHSEDGDLLHAVSLWLGYLPGVPFVSCRASDYENFSCSWTSSVETFLPTRYITTYRKKSLTGEEKRRNKNGHVGPCLQDPSHPGTCTVHGSEFWSSYRLNITEVNPLGSSFRLLDVTMQAIIKPDPPEGLVVEPIPLAPRRLHVSWKYPSSWPKEPHFQLRFRLQYRPVIHRSWSVVETVNLSEVITDAFAGLEHVVQVSAKDFLDAGNWSEWSAEARATPVTDPATAMSEETTTDPNLESLAEEPSQAPNPEPINRSDPLEKTAVLVSLGIFAFFVLAAVLVITILIWLRVRKHGKDKTKPNFLVTATHLKALPKAQIL